VALAAYEPPIQPTQIYSQAYWYAVIAAVLYATCAVLLMVNMIGYMLGHYTERFNLTDAQRTLILQSFMFFIWLAGGAGVFTAVEAWSYSNALYYCDVTILTIGFGDLTPHNNVGRGLVIPYALGGVLILGLMVSSISRFASELGRDKIVRKRFETSRSRTLERARGPSYSEPIPAELDKTSGPTLDSTNSWSMTRAVTWQAEIPNPSQFLKKRRTMRSRLIVLKEEKDRFETMRRVQDRVDHFKKYTTLTVSFSVLCVIWLAGAVGFWRLEQSTQSMTFFEAFYFCYVSLTTIGYGDFTPQSAGGRPFFVVWSLFAVPSITLLIGAASNTVVDSFNRWTNTIADFTLLPKHGIWRNFLNRHTKLLGWAQARRDRIEATDRIEQGFQVGPEPEVDRVVKPKTIEELALERPDRENRSELGRRLAHAIKQVTQDIKNDEHKRYSYEEWVEWTILIRFTSQMLNISKDIEKINDGLELDKGLIEWDWLGEDSPMMAEITEPEWLLDRLVESMARYTRNIVAFLRLEKERGYVIENAGSALGAQVRPATTSHGMSQASTPSRRRSAWQRVSGDGSRAQDQLSIGSRPPRTEEEAEEDEGPQELDMQESPRDRRRDQEVEDDLEQDEKDWDQDYERKTGRPVNMPGKESRDYHEGLPGLLGDLDNAARHRRGPGAGGWT